MCTSVSIIAQCHCVTASRARCVWDTAIPKINLGELRARGEFVLDLQARCIQRVGFVLSLQRILATDDLIKNGEALQRLGSSHDISERRSTRISLQQS